jgi:hypothetical protein
MKAFLIALAGGLLALPASTAVAQSSIRYETGPCFGRCPVYRVTVRANGRGVFEGLRFTAVTGTRYFRISPHRYQLYALYLRPLRPASGSVRLDHGTQCNPMVTDLPSAEVTWTGPGASTQSFYYYFGCNPQGHRAIADRLRRAPRLLPIAGFIGSP